MLAQRLYCLAEITCSKSPPLLQSKIILRTSRSYPKFHSRTRLEPDFSPLDVNTRVLTLPSLVKPLVFTVGFSSICFGGCAIWQYERLRAHALQRLRKPPSLFADINKKYFNSFLRWWNGLRDADKVFYPILLTNVMVFAAWRIRALQPFMVKYFCSNPASNTLCLPMVLSTFSHYSVLHLAANMFVLSTFMPAAVASMGKEQFVATYLSAGAISSMGSYIYKTITRQPGLSLGASGAIMAVLGYVCVQYPDTQLSIIFLPFYTFAAGNAIKVILGLDFAGCVMGWKFFDHAAHLGGALFGIGWCTWGSHNVWGHRDKVQQYWHSLRDSRTSR